MILINIFSSNPHQIYRSSNSSSNGNLNKPPQPIQQVPKRESSASSAGKSGSTNSTNNNNNYQKEIEKEKDHASDEEILPPSPQSMLIIYIMIKLQRKN